MRPTHLTFSLVKTSQSNKERNEGYESFTEVRFEGDKIHNSHCISILKNSYWLRKRSFYFILHTYLFGWTPTGNCAKFTRWKFLVCQFQRLSDFSIQRERFFQLWTNTLIKLYAHVAHIKFHCRNKYEY